MAILRRIAPALGVALAAVVLAGAGRAAWQRWGQPAANTVPTPAVDLTPLVLPAALVVGLVLLGVLTALAVRRWGLYLRMYWPVRHAAIWLWCLVMLAGGGVATLVWLQAAA